jgi:hypothetical protein
MWCWGSPTSPPPQVNQVNLSLPTAANIMLSPTSVTSDGTRLYVSDLGYNRVLIWSSIPTTNQKPADLEIGQKDMTTSVSNDSANLCTSNGTDANGNATYPARCGKTLSFPRYALPQPAAVYRDGATIASWCSTHPHAERRQGRRNSG